VALTLVGLVFGCQLDQLVSPPAPGRLVISPPALDETTVAGNGSAMSRDLAIQASGTDTVSWDASVLGHSPWLSLRSRSATAPGTLGVSIQPGTLAAGLYQDTVVVVPEGFEEHSVRVPITLTVRPPAIHLVFTVQPRNTRANSFMSPTVQVTAQDESNHTVTSWTGSVAIAIERNPSGGKLNGVTTVTASNGVARFTLLSIDKTGNDYTLKATSGSLTVTSNTFNITSH
jgi:hypothetical protein